MFLNASGLGGIVIVSVGRCFSKSLSNETGGEFPVAAKDTVSARRDGQLVGRRMSSKQAYEHGD